MSGSDFDLSSFNVEGSDRNKTFSGSWITTPEEQTVEHRTLSEDGLRIIRVQYTISKISSGCHIEGTAVLESESKSPWEFYANNLRGAVTVG